MLRTSGGGHLRQKGRCDLRQLPLEIALGVLGYVTYRYIRGAVTTDVATADSNAALIVDSTPDPIRHLEHALNAATSAHTWLARPAAAYYGTLHMVVTAAVLVWLWRARPHRYSLARSVLVAVTLIGLVGFWLFPVTPPRLYVPGATDIVAQVSGPLGVQSEQVEQIVNDYAAFPSLHIAWACWCAWAVALGSGRWARLAWLYPALTGLVLVSTANHYTWDLVAGVAAFAAAALAIRSVAARNHVGHVGHVGHVATQRLESG